MAEKKKDWVNVRKAAEYLQVSRETIYNLMDRGLLPYSEVVGVRGRRIRKEDLDALLRNSQGVGSAVPASTAKKR